MQTKFLELLGSMVVYGGGGAAVAFALFRWLGMAWIENKFKEKLKQLEHEQNLVVARLRIEIESMLGGALKLQERDFVVLPATLERLDKAYKHTTWFVSPAQLVTDVRAMREDELGEFMESSNWTKTQKQEVLEAIRSDRQKVYDEIDFYYTLREVKRSFADYESYVAANAIFFTLKLRSQLKEMQALLWSAITAKQVGVESQAFGLRREALATMDDKAKILLDEIEIAIRLRLESHRRSETAI